MKLRNKKTGELGTLTLSNDGETFILMNERMYIHAVKLKDLEDWEDVTEEPKEYWTIDWTCTGVTTNKYSGDDVDDFNKSIGNYFETKEEAEKAVEKLKAVKRLKDKGFRFERWCFSNPNEEAKIIIKGNCVPDTVEEIDLLFGGEE